MTAFRELSPEQQKRLEEAAQWRLRLRNDPSLELSSGYLAWVEDPQNGRALDAIEDGWGTVGELGASPEFLEMRQAALRRVRQAGVKQWLPRRMILRSAAAVLIAGITAAGIYTYERAQPAVYDTDVGERRIIALPDGSRISMDSDTEVRVRYSDVSRAVKLDRGRARFDVAHDTSRPFTVRAGTETVVAVGTSFNVERLGAKVVVTLIQGRVVIKSAAADVPSSAQESRPALRPPLSLQAGEQLVALADTPAKVSAANLQTATAWEAGHLIFKDETLAEAVERVNRYTQRPITVEPSVASLRISGVFNAGDVGSFVSAVTSYFPIQATTTSNDTIVLQHRS